MGHRWGMFLGLMLMASWVVSEPVAFSLARVFTDRAVLQRHAAVPLWGSAGPGVEVSVTFGALQRTAVTGADGRWRVDLPPLEADSEGRDLVVETSDGQGRTLTDVVVGDLWYCAGQSNMELGMAAIANRAAEMKDLKHPGLRLYLIPKGASAQPQSEVFGAWVPSDRVSVTSGGWYGFSAVAYTFGRRLVKEIDVPMGLIQAGYGGSAIQEWIPPEDRGLGTIWNAMVAPLGPLAIRGVLWYQGETDVGTGALYTARMNTLIAAFRRFFGRGELPFFFVQIAPWEGYGGDSLPNLWAAQEAVLATPGTGMALTVDVGDLQNIHPANKRPVGERLALQALSQVYGRNVVADGPVVVGWSQGREGVLVSWKASGPLATSDGAPPQGFEVKGSDGLWRPAEAKLTSAGVVLLGVSKVQGVRYAWSSTPMVNLTDDSGLPARPFIAPTGLPLSN